MHYIPLKRLLQAFPVLALACLPLSNRSLAAGITFGADVNLGAYGNCQGTNTELELDSSFDLYIRNCWNESVTVALTMTYHTPGGNPADPEQYGVRETSVLLGVSSPEESMCPILNVLGDPGNYDTVVNVHARTYSTATGSQLGETVSVQRAENAATVPFVTGQEQIRLESQIDEEFRVRSIHSPDGGNVATGDLTGNCSLLDRTTASVDNLGRLKVRGSLLAKVMCSINAPNRNNCRPSTTTSGGEDIGDADVATEWSTASFELAPEGCLSMQGVDFTNTEFFYHDCCDPQGPTPHATVTMQCVRFTVDEVEVDGQFKSLSRSIETPWAVDIEPTQAGSITSEDVGFNCESFDIPTTVDSLAVTRQCWQQDHLTPPTDTDGDGVYDECDTVVSSQTTPAGGESVTLRRITRNLSFADAGDFSSGTVPLDASSVPPTVADVKIEGASVGSFATANESNDDTNVLTFTAPSGIAESAHPIEVVPDASVGSVSSNSRDQLTVRAPAALVAVEGTNYISAFDTTTGTILDQDNVVVVGSETTSGFDNSVVSFPDPVRGVTYSTESNNENDETYVLSGARVYLVDDPAGIPKIIDIDDDPANGEETGHLVGLEAREFKLDAQGQFGFLLHDSDRIGAVQVQKTGIAALEDRFAPYTHIASVPGDAGRLVVDRLTNATEGPRFALYVTSSCLNCNLATTSCSTPMAEIRPPLNELPAAAPPMPLTLRTAMSNMALSWASGLSLSILGSLPRPYMMCLPGEGCEFLPDPPPGGGGGGGSTVPRKTILSLRVLRANLDQGGPLLDAADPWTLECAQDFQVSYAAVVAGSPVWEDVGLEFSEDLSALFVVSPETNELVKFDTGNNTETARVDVGSHPFDVEVLTVKVADVPVERAYVVNHGDAGNPNDDTLSIVNTGNFTNQGVTSRTLSQDFPPDIDFPSDIHLDRVTGFELLEAGGPEGKRLYLSSSITGQVLVYDLTPDGSSPSKVRNFAVGPGPGQIAVARP